VDRQCSLLGISRSSVYYQPAKTSQENLELRSQGYGVNRKRVRRLRGIMGLRAIHRRSRTSQPAPGHQVYPYLLRGVAITQPNQVWTSDLPTSPWLRASCMDWYSRYVLAWRLSNTLEAGFCVEALEEALRKGVPEIFNADQGAQFTSQACTALLEQHGVRVSMDGKGRYTDNLFIERLWRSLKYEEVYLKAYAGGKEARAGIGGYFSTTWSNPIRLWVTKPQQRCL
jgi:putative transposase